MFNQQRQGHYQREQTMERYWDVYSECEVHNSVDVNFEGAGSSCADYSSTDKEETCLIDIQNDLKVMLHSHVKCSSLSMTNNACTKVGISP